MAENSLCVRLWWLGGIPQLLGLLPAGRVQSSDMGGTSKPKPEKTALPVRIPPLWLLHQEVPAEGAASSLGVLARDSLFLSRRRRRGKGRRRLILVAIAAIVARSVLKITTAILVTSPQLSQSSSNREILTPVNNIYESKHTVAS